MVDAAAGGMVTRMDVGEETGFSTEGGEGEETRLGGGIDKDMGMVDDAEVGHEGATTETGSGVVLERGMEGLSLIVGR